MESCTVNLFGLVDLGHVFSIVVSPSEVCRNFKINFTDGAADIPLTIFVNKRINKIVLNSFLNGEWRESMDVESFITIAGEPFKFYVLVSEEKFHIALNDQNLCNYSHQTSVNSVRCIMISGDLEKIIAIDHRRSYPTPWPPIQEDISSAAFSSDVPYEFTPGSLIVLKMRLSGKPNGSFFIRFNERATKKQLFHFNPRFEKRPYIAVNSMNDSLEWLKDEKRFTNFPFVLNKEFLLAIAMTPSAFKVAVDGNHLLSHEFRAVKLQLPQAYSDTHPIFEHLTGFKIFAQQGMQLSVSKVDHIQLTENCDLYENFTHPSYA